MNKEKALSIIIISLVLISIMLIQMLPTQKPLSSTTTTTSTTIMEKTTTSQQITNNTYTTPKIERELLESLRILKNILSKKYSSINNTYIKPILKTINYYYKLQKLYEKFGGHGLIPLRSFYPYETEYFNPYSLEVSEYACEIPYIYAWLYWITGNKTYLDLVKYSVEAIHYWSIDNMPLGGCWGTTDPIVYDKYQGKYIIRWKLISWYAQTQLSWWNEEWFKKSIINSWNYTAWYDPIYKWYWFTPWETVYHGPPEEQEKYKNAFIEFVHKWIQHYPRFYAPPYAYIISPKDLSGDKYVKKYEDKIQVFFSPLKTRTVTLRYTNSFPLKNNTAYSFIIRLRKISGKINLTMIIYNSHKKIVLKYPVLPDAHGVINISMGSTFIKSNEGGNYSFKLIITPLSLQQVNLKIHSIGIIATPNMGDRSIIVEHSFWGDSIGPLSLAYLHYYPQDRNLVLNHVINVLREMYYWRTDKSFYPPDPRWSFYKWDPVKRASIVFCPPRKNSFNYASLEETLESMIPLVILTGDKELLNILKLDAKFLNHNNYWKGLGYWSAWFGIWTHLWLYKITGDEYFIREASHYIGTYKPFEESLREEVSNAAKFIEANIVAYIITGDEKYWELAEDMAETLIEEYTDPVHGYITPYRGDNRIARHDMFAWTISPLISLYVNLWVPDWMLWMYPIAIDDHGRPNPYFTVINVTYTPNAVMIWDTNMTMLYAEKYNGYIIILNGVKKIEKTPIDYFPYTIRIKTLDTSQKVKLVGFKYCEEATISYGSSSFTLSSSSKNIWIIKLDNVPANYSIFVDGHHAVYGIDYVTYNNYIIVKGSEVEITY